MGVWHEDDQPLLMQVVDDALHILAVGTQVAGEPRYGLRPLREHNGAENLPAGASQPERRDEPVAPCQRQDEVGQGVGCWGSRGLLNLTS